METFRNMAVVSSYRDYEQEARGLVKRLLSASLERYDREEEAAWPRGEEFTVERGRDAIEDFVKGWDIGEQWKYCIDFIDQRAGLYCYTVKWSVPTRRRPVPRATAAVYFYLTVHKPNDPVLVFYVVEGHRLVHRAGKTQFQAVWLRNVLDNKLMVTEAVYL